MIQMALHYFRRTRYVSVDDVNDASRYLSGHPLAPNENAELWEVEGKRARMLPYEVNEAGTEFRRIGQ